MEKFKFSVLITVRIHDLNYGNHVGYQNYLVYFQEARIAYLKQFGFSEHDIGGFRMLISSAECRYKQELLMGDKIVVGCRVSQLKPKMFIMDYQISRTYKTCALGSTTQVCFDPVEKKVANVPPAFVAAVKAFEGLV
jgi:acyl-CoA thioester hydrolase